MRRNDDEYRAYVEARRGELLRTAVLLAAGDGWATEDLVQTGADAAVCRVAARTSRLCRRLRPAVPAQCANRPH
jgi:hypothetical protein